MRKYGSLQPCHPDGIILTSSVGKESKVHSEKFKVYEISELCKTQNYIITLKNFQSNRLRLSTTFNEECQVTTHFKLNIP